MDFSPNRMIESTPPSCWEPQSIPNSCKETKWDGYFTPVHTTTANLWKSSRTQGGLGCSTTDTDLQSTPNSHLEQQSPASHLALPRSQENFAVQPHNPSSLCRLSLDESADHVKRAFRLIHRRHVTCILDLHKGQLVCSANRSGLSAIDCPGQLLSRSECGLISPWQKIQPALIAQPAQTTHLLSAIY